MGRTIGHTYNALSRPTPAIINPSIAKVVQTIPQSHGISTGPVTAFTGERSAILLHDRSSRSEEVEA